MIPIRRLQQLFVLIHLISRDVQRDLVTRRRIQMALARLSSADAVLLHFRVSFLKDKGGGANERRRVLRLPSSKAAVEHDQPQGHPLTWIDLQHPGTRLAADQSPIETDTIRNVSTGPGYDDFSISGADGETDSGHCQQTQQSHRKNYLGNLGQIRQTQSNLLRLILESPKQETHRACAYSCSNLSNRVGDLKETQGKIIPDSQG